MKLIARLWASCPLFLYFFVSKMNEKHNEKAALCGRTTKILSCMPPLQVACFEGILFLSYNCSAAHSATIREEQEIFLFFVWYCIHRAKMPSSGSAGHHSSSYGFSSTEKLKGTPPIYFAFVSKIISPVVISSSNIGVEASHSIKRSRYSAHSRSSQPSPHPKPSVLDLFILIFVFV